MSRSPLLAPLLAAVLCAGLGACSKKAPIAPPRDPGEAGRIQDVSRPSAAFADEAPKFDPLAETDLDRLNAYLDREGLLGDVYFAFDSYDLDTVARDRVESNARFLTENPDLVVRVEGHCDDRGTNEYNLALGGQRAEQATALVLGFGVASERLQPLSLGEEAPFCRESSESCRARNRRARFLVVGRKG